MKERLRVYPACAGIHLGPLVHGSPMIRLPRMRGDPPCVRDIVCIMLVSTPHARGSTRTVITIYSFSLVYPACAGIHLFDLDWIREYAGLPRMRGDPPLSFFFHYPGSGSTPHARGSTQLRRHKRRRGVVYPACAGIHPPPGDPCHRRRCLPRMRGDPPASRSSISANASSTPHARGSTFIV